MTDGTTMDLFSGGSAEDTAGHAANPGFHTAVSEGGESTLHAARRTPDRPTLPMVHVELAAIIVEDYDDAIRFFVDGLGFELAEDSPSLTNDGRPKRWVVVRPPGAETGLLLAKADGPHQQDGVGAQFAGRVGLFLRVDDFDVAYERMKNYGVEFVTVPRLEAFGRFAVFLDIAGNKWDLLGPRPDQSNPDQSKPGPGHP